MQQQGGPVAKAGLAAAAASSSSASSSSASSSDGGAVARRKKSKNKKNKKSSVLKAMLPSTTADKDKVNGATPADHELDPSDDPDFFNANNNEELNGSPPISPAREESAVHSELEVGRDAANVKTNNNNDDNSSDGAGSPEKMKKGFITKSDKKISMPGTDEFKADIQHQPKSPGPAAAGKLSSVPTLQPAAMFGQERLPDDHNSPSLEDHNAIVTPDKSFVDAVKEDSPLDTGAPTLSAAEDHSALVSPDKSFAEAVKEDTPMEEDHSALVSPDKSFAEAVKEDMPDGDVPASPASKKGVASPSDSPTRHVQFVDDPPSLVTSPAPLDEEEYPKPFESAGSPPKMVKSFPGETENITKDNRQYEGTSTGEPPVQVAAKNEKKKEWPLPSEAKQEINSSPEIRIFGSDDSDAKSQVVCHEFLISSSDLAGIDETSSEGSSSAKHSSDGYSSPQRSRTAAAKLASSAESVSGVLKGWVSITENMQGPWKKRWAVVHNNVLYMFPQKDASRPSTIVILDEVALEADCPEDESIFKIKTSSGRVLIMRAKSAASKELWVSNLGSRGYEMQYAAAERALQRRHRQAKKAQPQRQQHLSERAKIAASAVKEAPESIFWGSFVMIQVWFQFCAAILNVFLGREQAGYLNN
eukprot:CAMPEP_0171496026 /NCGR_PEP_ID=MMETSP0958-20121227/6468_1 /TAXON_ID=87120 /ORGANISM="Aurantiochytrium limacinum, Strain ATCCMYA-1381" /LENGTH=643 /DNA_ID=CAMNT_0012030073 /DNA_START=1214 /DNA_END=3145 /DNA_ORIENTATION=-